MKFTAAKRVSFSSTIVGAVRSCHCQNLFLCNISQFVHDRYVAFHVHFFAKLKKTVIFLIWKSGNEEPIVSVPAVAENKSNDISVSGYEVTVISRILSRIELIFTTCLSFVLTENILARDSMYAQFSICSPPYVCPSVTGGS